MDKQRFGTGILFFFIIIVALILSIWFPLAIVIYFIFVAFFASLELAHALAKKFKPLSYISIAIGSLTGLAPLYIWFSYQNLSRWHVLKKADLPLSSNSISNFIWLVSFGVLAYFIALIVYAFSNVSLKVIRKGPEHLPHAVAEASAAMYISIPLLAVVLFQYAVPNGFFWLTYAMISPMVTDVSAYYIGSALGKRKMIPHISPNKSWMGFFAGILTSMLFSLLYFLVFFRGEFPLLSGGTVVVYALLSGAIISLSSQLGDWVASSLKRWCEIKDFSNLLPGHGGLLDRFDSIFFSLPTSLILAIFFYLLKRG